MNGQQLTEDNFDDVARQAGVALRRPAPADGMTRIRQTRRRQQQVRAAAGGTALAAIIAVGAFVATRDDDSPALVIQPEQTVPGTTLVPDETAPPTTAAPTTTPVVVTPTTAPATTVPAAPEIPADPIDALGADTRAWVDARVAEGLANVEIQAGEGTTARLLTATDAAFTTTRTAVLLDDGRVVDAPASVFGPLYAVGKRPALVRIGSEFTGDTTWEVWALDEATTEWTTTGDLGLAALDGGWGGATIRVVDSRLIVANNQYVDQGDGTQVLSPNQAGVVVDGDLTVTPMTAAPDGVALFFTSASGGKALQMRAPAIEGGIGLDVPVDQPWQYDPVTNAWSEIPIPDWLDCPSTIAGTCPWQIVPDIGAFDLEVPTALGVVALVPDGTVGVYDARISAWTRVDDPPIELVMPTTALVDGQLVVAPWRSGLSDFSTIAVLDLDTGTWATERVEIPADVEARFGTEWTDVSWDLRVAGSRVLMAPGQSFQASTIDPIVVYDAGARGWYQPDARDVAAWQAMHPDLAP